MSPASDQDVIVFDNVSKFYGEVLGVNRVNLKISPGVTSLVGPNGSGKSTLMNLLTGLLKPSQGSIQVLGRSPSDAEAMFHLVGYCSQWDAFPKGLSGLQFVAGYLKVHGLGATEAKNKAWGAIQQVGLTDAADRKIAGYSKGMRQRIKLAQSIAHHPVVMVLDEPLNGLDPMARAETIELFTSLAERGLHVIISSHILHEVDMISDSVILLDNGYVVAEGEIRGVRSEVKEHPMQILIRCDRPAVIAAQVFEQDHVTEVKLHEDKAGLSVRTRDVDRFYRLLNQVVLENQLNIETVAPADEDVQSVYDYLIGEGRGHHS